jgi:hypothetical protein
MKTINEQIEAMEETTLSGIVDLVNSESVDYKTAQSCVLKNDEYTSAFIFATACEIAQEKDVEIKQLKEKIGIIEEAFTNFYDLEECKKEVDKSFDKYLTGTNNNFAKLGAEYLYNLLKSK